MNRILLLSVVLLGCSPAAMAAPITFSIDPASPAIDGNITPDDILQPGPSVYRHGTSLGLQDGFFGGVFDNLDALSYGRDPIVNPLFFSVDRVAVGVPGSAVNSQAAPGSEEAAGDVYRALPPFGSNTLHLDEQALGLTQGFFGDDLDALELDTRPAQRTRIYFSNDALSASNGFGAGTLANDIFINFFPIAFAFGEIHMGLLPFDDLDALVLDDFFQPGVLNPGIDRALFSLSTFSPSTFTFAGTPYNPGVQGFLSPADVLFTDFTGAFSLWASAPAIGLRPDDELDALDTVPEPALIMLLGSGVAAAMARRQTRRGHRQPPARRDHV